MATRLQMLIENTVAAARAGRWVLAGLGLTLVREHYEAFAPDDLPADERTWSAFAHKHLPLPPDRIGELIGRVVHRGGSLRCTSTLRCR